MKAVLIGYGNWGHIVRRYIEASNEFELACIYVRALPDDADGLFCTDWEAVISDNSMQAAFVCTSVASHYEICKALLEVGKHVFCEKPLAMCYNEAIQLKESAKEKGVILYTDYIYTCSPSINKIKELLPRIGNVYYAEGRITQFGRFYQNDTIWDVLGVHLVSAFLYIFSDRIFVLKDCKNGKDGGKEFGVLSLTSDNLNVDILCSLIDDEKARKITLYGEKGILRFDMLSIDATVTLSIYNENQEGERGLVNAFSHKYDEANNLTTAIGEFADWIVNGINKEKHVLVEKVERIMEDIANEY